MIQIAVVFQDLYAVTEAGFTKLAEVGFWYLNIFNFFNLVNIFTKKKNNNNNNNNNKLTFQSFLLFIEISMIYSRGYQTFPSRGALFQLKFFHGSLFIY